jgi:PPOX class probable F420-dependent enzyme
MGNSRKAVDDFLAQPRIGFLGTLNEDGSPNTMPLWYDWDGKKIRMFTYANASKLRRLRCDSRASLTAADGVDVPGNWVSVEGEIAILEDGGPELACALAVTYYEPAKAQAAIDVWSQQNDLLLLELTPTRIRAWSRVTGYYSEHF